MKTVGTAKLKNHLSAYLKLVRKGAGFIVTDHGEPIAKIVPLNNGQELSAEENLASLAASGLIKLPRTKKKFLSIKPVDLGSDIASRYVIEQRD